MHRNIIIVATVVLALIAPGCSMLRTSAQPALVEAAASNDALTIADALEALIAIGKDTVADREFAHEQVCRVETDSAADAFARAVVAGRVVQSKGLLAAPLLAEAETYARRSRELDPEFRDGAATRMLGTLYVMAPASLLKHGDSELGLDLLDQLTEHRPDVIENHLRLAEAYVVLHDPDPARPHLCLTNAARARLRSDDQRLLDRLLTEVGKIDCK